MATWKIKSEAITVKSKMEGWKTRTFWGCATSLTCRPAFPKTQRGWVTGPRGGLGQRRGHLRDCTESPPHPAETQKDFTPQFQTLNFNGTFKHSCVCLCTCRNKRQTVSTHRGAVCVGQREHNSLRGVDQWRPGQMRCYFSMHIFLKVCVDFKDSFNPLVREENILFNSGNTPSVWNNSFIRNVW